ncbi:hypothetical protein VTH06DRAFT_8801 [Thermothelomyces fergusii]
MAPKSDAGNQEEPNAVTGSGPLSALSSREQTILLQALLSDPNFPGCIQVDYAKVANRMNLKNPRSVSNAWTIIKNKIAAYDKKFREEHNLPSEGETATAAAENAGGDDNPSPKKRARTIKMSKPAAGGPRRGARAKKGVGAAASADDSVLGAATGSFETADEAVRTEDQDLLGEI